MLIECKECGHVISDQAVSCPNCGCPVAHDETEHEETAGNTANTTANTTDTADNYQKDEKATFNTSSTSSASTSNTSASSTSTTNTSASSASYTYVQPSKDKTVAAVLALILGNLGIHHFYLGNNNRGLSYLVAYFALWFVYVVFGVITFGAGISLPIPIAMTIIPIIDFVHYLQDDNAKFEERIHRETDYLWKKIIY